MKRFLLLCSVIAVEACVSSGPYFKLDELEDLVRDRYTREEVVNSYGQGKANFSESIFVAANKKTPSTEKLLIQEMDGLVFSAVQGEVEDDFNDMEFAPGELPRVASAKPSQTTTDFMTHSTETTEFNDCGKKKKKLSKLKYISERSDLNGYTEKQYAVLMVDQTGAVCGYKMRSIFIK